MFRVGSLIGGVTAIAVAPALVLSGRVLLLLLAMVVVFVPWAAVLSNSATAGTPNQLLRPAGFSHPEAPSANRPLIGWMGLALVVAAGLGHWLEWPAWWVPLYQDGVLAGPAVAVFLFYSASIYRTSIWLIERGAFKRCSNGHEFSPFKRACPTCTARKNLELVIDSREA